MRLTAAYGTWPSPVTPEVLVERAVGLADVEIVDGSVLWSEARPSEGGRQVLVAERGGQRVDLLPEGVSARTLVHEYGGRCYAAAPGLTVFSSMADQRLWRLEPDGRLSPLTPEPPAPLATRFADPVLHLTDRLVVCVRERHGEAVENDLVTVDLEADEPGEPVQLVGGHDFFAAPRLSPDGRRLAWLSWDHPDMPWDATELWSATFEHGRLGGATLVAGGPGISISQPRFAPDGTLHYLSDETGWWNLYKEGPAGALCPAEHDFGGPDWVFGQASYTFLEDGTLVATWFEPSGQRLGVVADGRAEPVATAFTAFSSLGSLDRRVAAIAASPSEPSAVVLLDPSSGAHEVLRASREVSLPRESISVPEPFAFAATDGELAYGLHYPPASATHQGLAGELPPLVVMSHGGPTAAARRELSMAVQFWTSRGFAVADVDYRGSSGYGRAYRDRLRGAWGTADVDDCAEAALALAERGLVDGARMVIRGASAGGFTVLNCLARRDVFAAGAALYGVTDLASLATDTHKFEAHYLDRLIGPWPEAAATYAERSPLAHVAGIRRPVILFQGSDDRVVPKSQSDALVAALEAAGVPVTYLVFEGEQHGFRRAETLVAVASAELAFYQDVLGLKASPLGTAPVDLEAAMRLALAEATAALGHDDVPVGALVLQDGLVVAARHNERELTGDPTAHAELLALRDAAGRLGRWRLDDCTLVSTLEPCPMCAGALVAARLGRLAFGAADPKAGACGSLFNLCADPRLNHELPIVAGLLGDEAGGLLKAFFASRRDGGSPER